MSKDRMWRGRQRVVDRGTKFEELLVVDVGPINTLPDIPKAVKRIKKEGIRLFDPRTSSPGCIKRAIDDDETPHLQRYVREGGKNARLGIVWNHGQKRFGFTVLTPDLPNLPTDAQRRIIAAPGDDHMSPLDRELLQRLKSR